MGARIRPTVFCYVNTLRPIQNGRHFADDTFKRIFLKENVRISITISPKFVHKGPINSTAALVQIMVWCRPGDKPLSDPVMVRLLAHICVTRPQWVKAVWIFRPHIILHTDSPWSQQGSVCSRWRHSLHWHWYAPHYNSWHEMQPWLKRSPVD